MSTLFEYTETFILFKKLLDVDYLQNEFVYPAASNEFEHYQILMLEAIKPASSTKKHRKIRSLYHDLASNYNLKSFLPRTMLY